MAIVLTDEMMDLLQGMDGVVAKAFLQGVRMAQNQTPRMLDMPTGVTAGVPKTAEASLPLTESAQAAMDTESVRRRPTASSYQHNRGAQAEVLRALFTGTASYTQLQEALRFDRKVVIRVLSQLQRQGDATQLKSSNGQEVWQLTPQGRHVAAVFVNNPGLKVMNTQVRQRLAAADKKGS
jgi:DNA-binding HxlR family transcriptional regulator